MIGTTVAHYQIEEKLGQGGMGIVYRAVDTRLGRPVALKILPPDLMKDPERRRRFVQEAKAASAVNHPAIAQIYDISEQGDVFYIAMEYIDGSTVRQLVQGNELDVASAVEVGIQVAGALGRAHQAGIIHRDIKSDNIMVTDLGHPKVLDFGLAKLLDISQDETMAVHEMPTMAMTQAGMVMGTVAYMSPEQARGRPADQRSDIFSFGIVLYEMATGRLPFSGESALDTMHAIAYEASEPITTIRGGLPHSLQRVVDRCLEKEIDQRYQDMAEVEADLAEVRREVESGITRSAPILSRLRTTAPRVGSLTSKGVLVAGFWTLLLGGLTITVGVSGGEVMGVVPFLILGLIVAVRFRGKRGRVARKFVKKARKEKPVKAVALEGDTFRVLMDPAPARTYVKLNALLASANAALYAGRPFELNAQDDADEETVRQLATSSALLWAREDL